MSNQIRLEAVPLLVVILIGAHVLALVLSCSFSISISAAIMNMVEGIIFDTYDEIGVGVLDLSASKSEATHEA
ncbi:hypothetical protein H5410_042562 [Solanum commersonii]|uniref:Uncharacterized protein n=1 Tax=Solanum commersonii TaxID=4109 RepID=A0A9J5XXU6_SOLCO|nr:hypothetical protein H5410_042562 [Solanum commersonii]